MDGVITPPLPPPQRSDHDLTTNRNGEVKPDNAPTIDKTRADDRSPAALMRSMGFCPTKYMTPLQFLCAVYNDDLALVFKNEKKKLQAEAKGGISLAYRVECAKTAARYMHMEMPKVSITDETGNFGESLMRAATAGNERVRRKTMIIEEIERISPDVPLSEANYPPHLGFGQQPLALDDNAMIEGENLNPEGDKNYNADDDHGS